MSFRVQIDLYRTKHSHEPGGVKLIFQHLDPNAAIFITGKTAHTSCMRGFVCPEGYDISISTIFLAPESADASIEWVNNIWKKGLDIKRFDIPTDFFEIND